MRAVVVTGVSGGIGAATAALFRKSGWRVVGVDRTMPSSLVAVDDFVRADLASSAEVASLIEALRNQPRIDVLVNNAAVQINRALVDTSDDEWAQVLDTNVRAPFQLIRGLHAELAARRGAIVNVSSVHAVATSRNVAAYAVSKAALVGLTRTAAIELADAGIRCNAVLPGAFATPMLEDGFARRETVGGVELRDALVARTPIGFLATPEQIAPTIVHLADSELSPYTTGQTVVVDGGAAIRLSTE